MLEWIISRLLCIDLFNKRYRYIIVSEDNKYDLEVLISQLRRGSNPWEQYSKITFNYITGKFEAVIRRKI